MSHSAVVPGYSISFHRLLQGRKDPCGLESLHVTFHLHHKGCCGKLFVCPGSIHMRLLQKVDAMEMSLKALLSRDTHKVKLFPRAHA